ncbi:hypothetical protein C7974DRAFT_20843 [Boeremia exigua]|uniref:uncharacterized protein n=1 Tax=Boeremia exigua TaxID=749465 RepID=UPI001E8D678F|nr:uncharacterized protein C7974DRAFT_20843 [Boeremia exigua]KAH6644432.1 hypothetical protein C7974DRAFT_20843 [Boeremia exigua]
MSLTPFSVTAPGLLDLLHVFSVCIATACATSLQGRHIAPSTSTHAHLAVYISITAESARLPQGIAPRPQPHTEPMALPDPTHWSSDSKGSVRHPRLTACWPTCVPAVAVSRHAAWAKQA